MPRAAGYRPWTPEEIEVVRVDSLAGVISRDIAKKLGRTQSSIDNLRQRRDMRGTFGTGVPRVEASEQVQDVTDGKVRTLDGPTVPRILTLEALLETARVNLDEWDVERHVINKWEVGARDSAGNIVVEPLWQVKAWLRRKAGSALAEHTARLMAHIAAETEKRRVVMPLRPVDRLKGEPHMLEVDLFDLHLGKLAWAPETGNDYDVEIADARAREALEDLLWQASIYPVSRILLPLGNDYYHVDTISGLTTAGTPQDRDTRYHRMFEWGRGLASWMVHRCAEIAPVVVPIVPGNHDTQSDYALGQALTWEYAKDPRVTIDNAPTRRKYQRWGGGT